jgi:hypothetical protein
VFRGVSNQELSAAGVTILKERPSASPRVDYWDVARYYTQNSVALEAAELVALDLEPAPSMPTPAPGYHVAWALRLDPTLAHPGFRRDTDAMIVFNDAETGEYLGTFIRPPLTVTPTAPPFTLPPTP